MTNEVSHTDLAPALKEAISKIEQQKAEIVRLQAKLTSIRARCLNLAQWLDKGCDPKHGATEASFIALFAKEPSDEPGAEPTPVEDLCAICEGEFIDHRYGALGHDWRPKPIPHAQKSNPPQQGVYQGQEQGLTSPGNSKLAWNDDPSNLALNDRDDTPEHLLKQGYRSGKIGDKS